MPANQRKAADFHKKVNNGSYDQKTKLNVFDAVSRIERELGAYTKNGHKFRVPPESITISCNVVSGKKGRPLSGMAEPEDPGVAVYFTLDGKDYCYPCDKWNRVADNMAAIAAHISALRGIERWGVGETADVYTGYKALPQNAGATAGAAWWIILQVEQSASRDEINQAARRLKAYYHPDAPTGNRGMFDLVQAAYEEAKA